MLDAAIRHDLLKEVERLPPSMQRRVVDYVRALADSDPQDWASYAQEYVDNLNLDPNIARVVKDDIEAAHGWIDPIGAAKSMIDWIYEKPHAYACTLGELDAILYCLHFVWARTLGRRDQYDQARFKVIDAGGKGALGLSDAERSQPISEEGSAIQASVITEWMAIDWEFEQAMALPGNSACGQ